MVQPGSEPFDDYLELAEQEPSPKKRIEYARKALELDDDNLDAARIIIDETASSPLEAKEEYAKLVEKGTKILEKDGYFDKKFRWRVLASS